MTENGEDDGGDKIFQISLRRPIAHNLIGQWSVTSDAFHVNTSGGGRISMRNFKS